MYDLQHSLFMTISSLLVRWIHVARLYSTDPLKDSEIKVCSVHYPGPVSKSSAHLMNQTAEPQRWIFCWAEWSEELGCPEGSLNEWGSGRISCEVKAEAQEEKWWSVWIWWWAWRSQQRWRATEEVKTATRRSVREAWSRHWETEISTQIEIYRVRVWRRFGYRWWRKRP